MFLALTDYTVYDKTTGEVNHENLKKASSLLQNNGLELTSQKGNKITATTSLQKAETIYTSIPYDTSWRIYVNGQKVQPKPFMQSFISFDVPKGEAEI